MEQRTILTGHTSKETAYAVEDYPYGYKLRTTMYYWVESKPGKGDRVVTQTINPKNNAPNARKMGTYSVFKYLYLDEKGHVQFGTLDFYDLDKFASHFGTFVSQVKEVNITPVQQANLRSAYLQRIRSAGHYEAKQVVPASQQSYAAWLESSLTHIKTCPFKDLVKLPAKPVNLVFVGQGSAAA